MNKKDYENLSEENIPYHITSLAERFFLYYFQQQQKDFSVIQYSSFSDDTRIDSLIKSGNTLIANEIKLRQYDYEYIRSLGNGVIIELKKYNALLLAGKLLGVEPWLMSVFQPNIVVVFNLNQTKQRLSRIKRNDGKQFNSENKTSEPCYLLPFEFATIYQSNITINDCIDLSRKRLFSFTKNSKYLLENIIKKR